MVDKYRKTSMQNIRQLPGVVTSGYSELAASYEAKGRAGEAFSKSVLKWKEIGDDAYLSKMQIDAQKKKVELTATHKHDPEGFQRAWNTWQVAREQVQNKDRPFLGDKPKLLLDEIGTSGFNYVYKENEEKLFNDAKDKIKNNFESLTNDFELTIAQGEPGALLDFGNRIDFIKNTLDNAVDTPYFFPQDIKVETDNMYTRIVAALARKSILLDQQLNADDPHLVDRLHNWQKNFETYPKKTILGIYKQAGHNDDELKVISDILDYKNYSYEELDDISTKAGIEAQQRIDATKEKLASEQAEKAYLIGSTEQMLTMDYKKGISGTKSYTIGLGSLLKEELSASKRLKITGEIIKAQRLHDKVVDAISGNGKLQYAIEEDRLALQRYAIDTLGISFNSLKDFMASTTFKDTNGNIKFTENGIKALRYASQTSILYPAFDGWIQQLNDPESDPTQNAILGVMLGNIVDNSPSGKDFLGHSDVPRPIKHLAKNYSKLLSGAYNEFTGTFDQSKINYAESWRKKEIEILDNIDLKTINDNAIKSIETKHIVGMFKEIPDMTTFMGIFRKDSSIDSLLDAGNYPMLVNPGILNDNDIPDINDEFIGLTPHLVAIQRVIQENLPALVGGTQNLANFNAEEAFQDKGFVNQVIDLLKNQYGLSITPTEWTKIAVTNIKNKYPMGTLKGDDTDKRERLKKIKEEVRKIQWGGPEYGFGSEFKRKTLAPFFGTAAEKDYLFKWSFNDPKAELDKMAQAYDKNYKPEYNWAEMDVFYKTLPQSAMTAFIGRLKFDIQNNQESYKPGGGTYTEAERKQILKEGPEDVIKLIDDVIKDLNLQIDAGIDDEDNILFPLQLINQGRLKFRRSGIHSDRLIPYYIDVYGNERNIPNFPSGTWTPDFENSPYHLNTTIINDKFVSQNEDLNDATQFISKIFHASKNTKDIPNLPGILDDMPPVSIIKNAWNDDRLRLQIEGGLKQWGREIERSYQNGNRSYLYTKPGIFKRNIIRMFWKEASPKEQKFMKESFSKHIWQQLNLE